MGSKLYRWSKKIHRLLFVGIIVLGLFMMGTGLLMRYPGFQADFVGALDPGLIRYLHNRVSTYFAIVLTLNILTGIVMYIFPAWQRRRAVRSAPPSEPPH